jgi:hypothetical protein
MMRLWRIWQTENGGYDTYDSAVVVAESEEDARKINPDGEWGRNYSAWAPDPSYVSAMEIGTAAHYLEAGSIVIASFNAG